MNKIPIISVVGPTASGKTGLAVEIATKFGGEVVSADSMQIYKHMNIGTAKPTKAEMNGIKHHLMDFAELDQSFSVADYVESAKQVIEDIHTRGKVPILTGGTGLYISSLINNIQFSKTESFDSGLREELYKIAETKGNKVLHEMLRENDPISANAIHENNIPRVVRAIEIYKLTGTIMSVHQQNSRKIPSIYNSLKIGLTYRNRATLYDRIGQRVDEMLSQGLIEEAKGILSSENASTAMQAIGYKELAPYFIGEKTLEQAVETLKQETRRYAKRQLTWFNRDEGINWFYVDDYESKEKLQKRVNICVEQFL